MTYFMLHPKDNFNLKKYNRKYKYDAKKEISSIKQPYLYKKDFSYKEQKADYFDSKEEIYIGVKDIDRIADFQKEKVTFLSKKQTRKKFRKMVLKI